MSSGTQNSNLDDDNNVEERGFTFEVGDNEAGSRLDIIIASHISNGTRNFAAGLIKKDLIQVSGIIKKPGYRVKSGEIITGSIPPPEYTELIPQKIEIDIVYEDSDVVVVNKPANLVVHPAPGHPDGTLVNALLYHCPDIEGIGGEVRPGIVHRLDKDTTGLMVVAKNQFAHNSLTEAFKAQVVDKRYVAVVYGLVKEESGRILFPVGRHPVDRKKMSIRSNSPRSAETLWEVDERLHGATLLNFKLLTGRTHQIRVHCLAMNHPIIGDQVYGPKKVKFNQELKEYERYVKAVGRQMLHSYKLSFDHPVTGIKMTFQAPMPEDMSSLVTSLKL